MNFCEKEVAMMSVGEANNLANGFWLHFKITFSVPKTFPSKRAVRK